MDARGSGASEGRHGRPDQPRPTAGEVYRRAHGIRVHGIDEQPPTTPIRPAAVVAAPAEPRRRTHRPRVPRRAGLAVARVAVVVCSVLAMAVTGVGWYGVSAVGWGLDSTEVLDGAPKSGDGAENILLIGLDSRKDKNGNDLDPAVMKQLHAGDGQEGGYNTNTLIVLHIPADRKNIVAFSIPRDDLVTVFGLDVEKAKIKEVYGRNKAKATDELVERGVTDQSTLEAQGREAGRAATLQAVRDLTGVPIDRFAEVSLIGFYDLAKALGGVDVCLKQAATDEYSGANFVAGRQRLNAAQSLAFVRQRHGLDNGDLDRTHRQQAFLLSALHQIESAGTLTDLGKLNKLMAVVNDDVVLSSGWDVVDWARQMTGVADQRITFRTLPVVRYDTYDGQDVNIIDPQKIRAEVRAAFGLAPQPTTAQPTTAATPTTGADSESADGSGGGDTADTADTTDTSDAPAPDNGAAVVTTDGGVPCVN